MARPPKYVPPKRNENGFNCPHCGAFSHQLWEDVYGRTSRNQNHPFAGWFLSLCKRCGKRALWYEEGIVYPDTSFAPPPHPDLPEALLSDYQEAARIATKSPRGAAALLRLCIQNLCKHLGQSGKDIDKDIAALVQGGLPIQIQQMLDTVRVVGNNAIHPGKMDIRDDTETVTQLFDYINLITEHQIAVPKRVQELYKRLPEGAREHIEERDAKR